MAWKDLKSDIAAEFEGFSDAERVTAARLLKRAGSRQNEKEERQRDAAIPETPVQRLQRLRQARADRVAGLARGQKPNAAYQRKHMEQAYAAGVPRPGTKHTNENLKGTGARRSFVPTRAQQKLIDNRSTSAEVLAVMLGVSRVTAFRLRRKSLTGKAR
jgi:hypothetical protein